MYYLYTHCFERDESVLISDPKKPSWTRKELIDEYALRFVEDSSLLPVKQKYRLITDPILHQEMKDKWLAHYTIVDEDGEMNDE